MNCTAPPTPFPGFVAWLLAILALGSPLSAQESAPESRGFWWDAGLGFTSMQVTCRLCTGDIDSGPSIDLAAGTWASPRVAVGVELGGWTHLDSSVRERVLRAGLTGRFTPSLASGLHFLGGLGWMAYRADQFHYSTLNLLVGLGWRLPVSPGWSVGNRLVFDAAPFATLKNDGVSVPSGSVRSGALRLSVFVAPR